MGLNFQQKKEELVKEFNRNNQALQQLQARQQQIVGILNFIAEITKTGNKENSKEENKNKEIK